MSISFLTNYHIFIINVPHTAFGFNLAFFVYCSSLCSVWKFFEEKFFKVLYPLHQWMVIILIACYLRVKHPMMWAVTKWPSLFELWSWSLLYESLCMYCASEAVKQWTDDVNMKAQLTWSSAVKVKPKAFFHLFEPMKALQHKHSPCKQLHFKIP